EPDPQSQHHAERSIARRVRPDQEVLPQRAQHAGQPARHGVHQRVHGPGAMSARSWDMHPIAFQESSFIMRAGSDRGDESGMALVTVFMVLMLASALMVGFFATIVADQR